MTMRFAGQRGILAALGVLPRERLTAVRWGKQYCHLNVSFHMVVQYPLKPACSGFEGRIRRCHF